MPNAFAMTMLCCEPESQQKAASLALLAAAFDAFPDKDYCLLTLPPDSPEVPLLARFTRLPPPPGAALVEVLYLFHRCALLQEFQVGTLSAVPLLLLTVHIIRLCIAEVHLCPTFSASASLPGKCESFSIPTPVPAIAVQHHRCLHASAALLCNTACCQTHTL